jgi:hypothetical protein
LHHYAAAAAWVVVAKTRAVAHDEANPRNLPIHYAEMVLYARDMCIYINGGRCISRRERVMRARLDGLLNKLLVITHSSWQLSGLT